MNNKEKFNIDHIAKLSCLKLSEEEQTHFEAELNAILNLVDELKKVDTANIQPMAHPLDLVQPLRADKVTEENNREAFQAIAPSIENDLYLVPKVIESE